VKRNPTKGLNPGLLNIQCPTRNIQYPSGDSCLPALLTGITAVLQVEGFFLHHWIFLVGYWIFGFLMFLDNLTA
jgi:hypothetical protein